MNRIMFVGLVALVAAQASAQTPCEAPRIRDVAPLSAAVAQDKAMAQSFLKTSQACQMAESDACDAARLECTNQLASTLRAQVGLDEGAWLRDMLLPYSGLTYPPTRAFQAGAMAMDTACNGDANQLMSASSRRSLQAARRQAIADEYPRYVQWVQDQAKACRDRASVDESRRAQERADAEKLAAAALAAKTAEELRQKAEAEARKKADEAKQSEADARKELERKQREAQEKAQEKAERERKNAQEKADEEKERLADEKAAAEKKAKEEREAAERRAKDEKAEAEAKAEKERDRAEKKAEDERERAEKAARDAKDEKEAAERKAKEEAERAKDEAERKAKEAEELRLVKAREDRKLALKTQKEKLTQQATEAERRATEIANMSFTAEQSQQAAQLNTERVQALERAKTLRQQAAEIVIDDLDERSRGSVGLMGGGGVATWPGPTSGAVGGQALLHFGFWGTAPADGMASGFEVRVLGRFLATVPTTVMQAEGVASARYFFGRIGIGAAMELRWNQPQMLTSTVNIGFGPTLGVAFVDNPKTRVMLNAAWLPLTQQGFLNAYRTTGDLEISYEFLTFNIAGGLQTQPVSMSAGTILAWYFGAFAGVRLHW